MANLPDDITVEQAQASLDEFCRVRGDARLRLSAVDGRATVLTVAEREPLAPVPTVPFPATISEERVVSAQALVAWRGNFYPSHPSWPAPTSPCPSDSVSRTSMSPPAAGP